ncbi:CTP-dependent riboflavin kinase [Euryarchaeota archaeon]|nr:CTP-dependent riboflavin kinase [Euryarchaeota archaeon]|tara:strand:- start:475 stop:948 length:474 start_codon:yes stop_codon:yes gene_type:complete
MELRGTVSSGLGRAHIFMAQSHYQDQFKRVLGVTAWPGTLNIKVEGEFFVRYLALRNAAGIETAGIDESVRQAANNIDMSEIDIHRIQGFEREGRSFGGATAIIASLNTVDGAAEALDCAILIPDLTRHTDVVEVIASAFLREALDLLDGDELLLSY